MTTNETEYINPVAFEILTALIKQTADTTNDLLDLQNEDINFWQNAYITLFEQVVEATQNVSTPQLERVLNRSASLAEVAANSIEYRNSGS